MTSGSFLGLSRTKMTIRSGPGSRKQRKDRLRHRSRDQTDSYCVGFNDLDKTFEGAYPWVVKIERRWQFEEDLTELLGWCADNFGPSDYFMPYVRKNGSRGRYQQSRNVRITTRMRWNHIGWTFYFKTQEDATLFKVCRF
ncbi:MAG: hypothetical protein EOO77_37660 [Oxalobacteraceae bacterium]|nr:MAG: hypothetical protein EOO77_37660 [Oxalobacteraceae bacterium]